MIIIRQQGKKSFAMKKIIYILFCYVLLAPAYATAQVTIAPTNLFIDSQSRFGTYMIINGSNQAQEISIEFLFGYSDTDEQGNRSLVYDDPQKETQHSIADQVRAFPRNFTLQPGQRQIVRLRVNAPADLDDGTYWARIKTTSSPEAPPVELQSTETVTARVGFKIEQITGLYLKKGDVTTGIVIGDMRTNQREDGILEVLADVNRIGNSPFLGTITANIYDSNNKKINTPGNFVSTTIFFDGVHKQEINVSSLAPGTYRAELVFETQRNDISSGDIVQSETSSKSVTFSKQ